MNIADPIIASVIGLGVIAAVAAVGAYYYAVQCSKLRAGSAAAYQLASHLVDDLNDLSANERNAGEELLLDVLSDPDGRAAQALVGAPAGTDYYDILVKAGAGTPRALRPEDAARLSQSQW